MPLPSSTLAVSSFVSAVTRSLLPSPLKSVSRYRRVGFPWQKTAWPETYRHHYSCSWYSKVSPGARVSTDTGLDRHITAAEDPYPVEARGVQNPPIFSLEHLRLLVD